MQKLKLYFLVIRPVVTYVCETWILKETITNRLDNVKKDIKRLKVPNWRPLSRREEDGRK